MAGGKAVEAVVVEILPASTYRVELASREQVLAHLGPAAEASFVRLRLRDKVLVHRSSEDPSRGRIVRVVSRS